MKFRMRVLTTLLAVFALIATIAWADEPDSGPNGPAQVAADVIKDAAGADAAFIAGGLFKTGKESLSSLMQYPTDTIMVVGLTGSQIKQAIERSLSVYPQPNPSFLQISGMEVHFNKNSPSLQRVASIQIGGMKMEDSKTYQIAMPSTLAKGGYGYFKIWKDDMITKSLPKTLGEALKGHRIADTAPRYTAND